MAKNYYPLYKDGKLDPQSEEILKQSEEAKSKSTGAPTVMEAREGFLEKSWLGPISEKVSIGKSEIDGKGGKIPLHIYTPEGKGPFPVLLFFHGGGFVLGTLEEFDPFCSMLAEGGECVVVSVGYRRAPESKHPAAVEDAFSALEWIKENGNEINADIEHIAVAGDSAGGNLASVISIMAREKGIKLVYQVLICPWLDMHSHDRESYKLFGDGLWLSANAVFWCRNHYLQNEEQSASYLASPGLAPDLSGLPPALIIAAEFDVLYSEGKEFEMRLKEAGIPVEYFCYEGMLHDFVILPGVFDKANDAITKICRSLKKVFYK